MKKSRKIFLALSVMAFFILTGIVYLLAVRGPAAVSVPGTDKKNAGPAFEKKSVNVLLIGLDTWEEDCSRSDLLIVANMDFTSKKIAMVSIPRDTMVYINDVGFTKISHAHYIGEINGGSGAGTKETIRAVSRLLQAPLNWYLKVNLRGFRDFIDHIGGLEVELEKPVRLTFAGVVLPSGRQLLKGDEALEFVRERLSLEGGDFDRQDNQFLVIKAIAGQLYESVTIFNLPEFINTASKNIIDTNLQADDFLSMAAIFWGIKDKDFSFYQIPGKPYSANDPLLNKELYYWIPDACEVERISRKYLNGGAGQ